jgi:hypothetical protein
MERKIPRIPYLCSKVEVEHLSTKKCGENIFMIRSIAAATDLVLSNDWNRKGLRGMVCTKLLVRDTKR